MTNTLQVIQLDNYNFEVKNNTNIDCKVKFYNDYVNKVSGKGSRKYKEEILQAVSKYLENKKQQERKRKENYFKNKREKMIQSKAYKNIDLQQLYEVVRYEFDYYTNDYVEVKSLLTGLEIKDELNNVIEFKEHRINNTDIYCLGNDSYYERKSLTDDRIFIIGLAKSAYVTGLTLKELLFNGFKTYNNVYLVTDNVELNTVLNYGDNKNLTTMLIGDIANNDCKNNVRVRIKKELERAKNNEIKINEERFTKDNKPIRKAFFSSKPANIEEVKNKQLATYDDYSIVQSVTLDKNTFDLFIMSLDMSLLPDKAKNFKGGTFSTYEGLPIKDDIFKNDTVEQQKWIDESYRLVLEVKCNDYDYSLLIDPQGYNYPRYMAILDN